MRFFVLTFDAVYYFKFEEDFLAGRPAKGRIQLDKSIFFCEHDPASGDHLLQFRSLARVSASVHPIDARPRTLWLTGARWAGRQVFKARCEGPTQFVWWGDVMKAAYLIQMRTWSPAEVDQWVQLVGCNQTDLFSSRNCDGAKLISCATRECVCSQRALSLLPLRVGG